MEKFDFLVIGGGIAGLSFALDVAEHGSVAVLFKKELFDSSTDWAQGGIAAVTSPDDNFDPHIEDTLRAGAGLCNPEIVKIVVTEGPEQLSRLIERGAHFSKENSSYHLHKEAGHSKRRIYHAADATGHEVQRALVESAKTHPNIKIFSHACAIDLITSHKIGVDKSSANRVVGAYVLIGKKIERFVAGKVMVATGGAGKVYLYTSNPDIASGDGISMCYRAGVPIANMEFFQFHPTCLYHPEAKTFLITEAMRGEGAKLRRVNGERFMHLYHKDEELAPRDSVARAIDLELKKHGEDYVLLDITHRGANFIKEHFPMIHERCLKYGFDITSQPIPVVPAAHYLCGGVVCNEWGETNLQNLYVAGECTNTGLHGANRLASNSLLEGLVFARRAALRACAEPPVSKKSPTIPSWDSGSAVDADEQVVITHTWDEIRRFMWNYVGIVRSNKRLERALRRSEALLDEIREYYWNFTITPDLIELRNLSIVANLVIRSALARKESRGLHFNIDYPEMVEEERHDTVLYP